MDDKKQIDLDYREYRAQGVKGEPFFGAGWPFGAAALTTIIVGTLFREASFPVYFFGAMAGAVLGYIFQQFQR